MPITVFYSWQTDTPSKVNRNLIEDALKKAIKNINADTELVLANRDEVRLDKDTAGLPGSPAIVDAIFDKIDQCAVFVPDVTFVAKTERGRLLPNPNVLIEYGRALKARSSARIAPVMNEAFGKAIEKTPEGHDVPMLPFNMRHLIRPLAYTYDGSESPAKARNQLAGQLTTAIRTVLENAPAASIPDFEATPSTYEQSVFFDRGETLVTEGRDLEQRLYVPEQGPKMFLRLLPTRPYERLSSHAAYKLLLPEGERAQPLCIRRVIGGPCYRNRWGAVVLRAYDGRHIEEMTQLLVNRELWGISSELMKDNAIPTKVYEGAFDRALASYLEFARDKLALRLPLKVIAGLTGVEGLQLAVRFGYQGKAFEPDIVREAMVEDWDIPPNQILLPFYELVWEAFGLERAGSLD